ncbi:MAG: hypothetical protein ACK5LV_11495 [Lachnospirales bacterium]
MDIELLKTLVSEIGGEDSEIPFDKLMAMSDILEKFKNVNGFVPYKNSDEKDLSEKRERLFMDKYEHKVNENGIKNIHKILPYLNVKHRKSLAMYTKITEYNILKEMLEAEDYQEDVNINSDILCVIRDNLGGREKSKFDEVFKMINMMELMGNFKGVSKNKTKNEKNADNSLFEFSEII